MPEQPLTTTHYWKGCLKRGLADLSSASFYRGLGGSVLGFLGQWYVGVSPAENAIMVLLISILSGFAVLVLESVIRVVLLAPVKLAEETNLAILEAQRECQARQTQHDQERQKLLDEIQSLKLNSAARQSIRNQLGEYLLDLEDRIAAIKKMFMFKYRDSKTNGKDATTQDLIGRISSYLNSHLSTSEAAFFLSTTGLSHTPEDPQWSQGEFREDYVPWHFAIDYLSHYADQLKQIIQKQS